MLNLIENQFSAAARTPKGSKTLRAIFRATARCASELGVDAASLDIIANHAGLTQAALRHYFPTRDDLLAAFFYAASDWLKSSVTAIIASNETDARVKLEQLIGCHLEYMESVDTALWLGAQAFWLRTRSGKKARNEWYSWLRNELASLIGKVQPALSISERKRRAYVVLTLTLGGWITHGKGSRMYKSASVVEQRQLLIDAALEIATL
jgi:AcrR family transcriptional regulator